MTTSIIAMPRIRSIYTIYVSIEQKQRTTISVFLIPVSLEPNVVDLGYVNLWIVEFKGLENFSLWQWLNSWKKNIIQGRVWLKFVYILYEQTTFIKQIFLK